MSDKVVILIFAHKPMPEWYEAIGLEQCFRVLGRHPIRMVCPIGLDVSAYRRITPGLEVDFIPSHWLASNRAYNRMKILPFLYRRYSGYEYMLTYELDAFVFKDELEYWFEQPWDYIGAPWFEGYDHAAPGSPPIGVGKRRIFPPPYQHRAAGDALLESNPPDTQCVLGVAELHRYVAERTLAVGG
jgi:hypothetical protein